MKKVLIVGGGLGGLSAALALRQHGIAVDLIEASRNWTVQHDGMLIQEHALRAMVEEAGVTVRVGVSFVEMRDLGRAVGVRFTDNTSGGYDLVVGADGADSKVREVVFGNGQQGIHKGRVVLIGDAVHAISTHPGQESAQAVKDGILLGELCGQRMPVEEMLAAFGVRRADLRLAKLAGPVGVALRSADEQRS